MNKIEHARSLYETPGKYTEMALASFDKALALAEVSLRLRDWYTLSMDDYEDRYEVETSESWQEETSIHERLNAATEAFLATLPGGE